MLGLLVSTPGAMVVSVDEAVMPFPGVLLLQAARKIPATATMLEKVLYIIKFLISELKPEYSD